MVVFTSIPLASLVCYSVLFIFNIRHDLRNKVHSSFTLYLLTMVVWSLGSLLAHIDHPLLDTLLWNRFMIIGSTAMPIAFFHFVNIFLKKERRGWLVFGVTGYFFTQAANLFGYIVKDAFVQQGELHNTYGSWIILPSLSWVLFIGLATLDLLASYRSTKNVVYRNRIKYLLIVIIVIFIGSLTNSTSLGVFPVDIAFNVVAAGLIAYAILRYQLVEIAVVIRESLLYSVPTFMIGVSTFLVIYHAWTFFQITTGIKIFFLSLFVAALNIFIGQPLNEQARAWVDRYLFREKYDLGMMLERVSRTVAAVLDIQLLTNMILGELTGTMHISKAAFFLKDEKSSDFSLFAESGVPAARLLKLRSTHPLVKWLYQYDEIISRTEIDVIPQFRSMWDQEVQELDRIGAVLFLAIKTRDNLIGILAVGPKRSGETYSLDDQRTLTTLASQSAVAIENARLYEAERQQAIRDPLTDLYNRRYMEETLDRELSRAERKGTPLGIIMIDIDHFKQFNDTFGHDVGDIILRETGQLLKEHIRKEDVACRFGGEEFILILPETPLDIVRRRAEELREGAKRIHLRYPEKLFAPITWSLGVSVFPDHGSSAEALLHAADVALYQSKGEGRDRIVVAGKI